MSVFEFYEFATKAFYAIIVILALILFVSILIYFKVSKK
jgi:hypothetical protein